MTTRLRPSALLLTAAAVLALTACGSAGSTAAVQAKTTTPPPPAPSPAPSDTAPPGPWTTWCMSTAFTDNEAAVGEANATIQDVNSNDYVTAAGDGAALEAAALKAGGELPPAGRGVKLKYGLYFGWLAVVGKDLAAGNVSGADGAAVQVVKFRPAVVAVDARCKSLGA